MTKETPEVSAAEPSEQAPYETPAVVELGSGPELILGGNGKSCDNQSDNCYP